MPLSQPSAPWLPLTPSRASNPLCRHGLVTTPNHLASQTGLHVLRRGGNALEAALAAAATLTVVYPQMCTLGGDSFCLFHDAVNRELKGLNASGRAGHRVTRGVYAKAGLSRIPSRGPLAAITVPGIVSGWKALWEYSRDRMGGALSFAGLLEDARLYAEEGFPVSSNLARWLRVDTDEGDREERCLQRFPGFARIFYALGRVPAEGEILRQPDLARTLGLLANRGPEDFYEGEIAASLVRGLAEVGGLLDEKDLRDHTCTWVEPLRIPYGDPARHLEACNLPPNCQGISSLQILGIIDALKLTRRFQEGSADYLHGMVEATKVAFAMRERLVTDPDFFRAPLADMLDPASFARWAAAIDMGQAKDPGFLLEPTGDTIWLGVVDGQGNAVSYIQSVYNDFGSGIVPGGTGVLLQNRGCFFSLDPDHPNTLEPGKRTMHTLNPPMILENGRPRLVYGTMGGEGQPQTQAAVATRILDYGLPPQAAVDAPRWLYGRTWGAASNSLKLEDRFAEGVAEDLARRGHEVEKVAPCTDLMGHAGAILVRDDGVLQGATDPRGDGLALGW